MKKENTREVMIPLTISIERASQPRESKQRTTQMMIEKGKPVQSRRRKMVKRRVVLTVMTIERCGKSSGRKIGGTKSKGR
jgi:hypothetical protein